MKNFGLVAAVAALVFTTSVSAQEETKEVAMVETTEVVATVAAYEPIEISALPEAVTTAVATDFAGASITEAYKDEADNFKVVLAVGEESKTVYANASGEWIESNE